MICKAPKSERTESGLLNSRLLLVIDILTAQYSALTTVYYTRSLICYFWMLEWDFVDRMQ